VSAAQIRFFSLLRRELNRFLKIKRQTVGAPLLETFLYISVFGAALGSRIDTLHGFDYVVFIVPGLIMMAWATNAFSNNSSSILQQKFQRAIDDQLSSPASPLQLLLAFSLGGFVRGMTVATLTFVAASMDGHFRAFDTATGTLLWKAELPAGGQATPMSYAQGGRQYVVICAGGHGKLGTKTGDSVVAFALPEGK